jgi:hypothetical protein
VAFLTAPLFKADLVLAAAFFVGLPLEEGFAFAVLRETAFWATALLALGRGVLGLAVRFFAAVFGDERRAAARDAERLKVFVTALILKT